MSALQAVRSSPQGQRLKMRHQFVRYLIVGAFLGVATLLIRAILERLLPESRVAYPASVIFAYAAGIAAGFFLHAHFTFRRGSNSLLPRQFIRFVTVALAQIVVVGLLATWLRYSSYLASLNADVAGAVALVIAVGIAAVATFLLHRAWVYD
ncbi:MAG: GtrA family protein [Betaproteobacteria bacterium]